MQQYLELLRHVKTNGTFKDDRTGTGTYSVFGHQTRYDLSKGFPLLTTKKLHLKSIVHELLWFLKGETNIAYLKENGVKIWDSWANEDGELGPVYGEQWRSWKGANGQTVDQIEALLHDLKNNPNSRRLIVSAWNPSLLPDGSETEPKAYATKGMQALPPCHCLFQFYVSNGKLSCQLYQRSADIFLGVPFNIASYALLTHMLAQVTGLEVGDFVHTLGDAHLYSNHMEQVDEQLARIPGALPQIKLNADIKNLYDFTYDDIEFLNYEAAPTIRAKVAV